MLTSMTSFRNYLLFGNLFLPIAPFLADFREIARSTGTGKIYISFSSI
jgi:hypothetical protein